MMIKIIIKIKIIAFKYSDKIIKTKIIIVFKYNDENNNDKNNNKK